MRTKAGGLVADLLELSNEFFICFGDWHDGNYITLFNHPRVCFLYFENEGFWLEDAEFCNDAAHAVC